MAGPHRSGVAPSFGKEVDQVGAIVFPEGTREEAEQERGAEGDRRDDKEVAEGGHAPWSSGRARRYGPGRRNARPRAGTVAA